MISLCDTRTFNLSGLFNISQIVTECLDMVGPDLDTRETKVSYTRSNSRSATPKAGDKL